jgi:hypothetical protein
MPIIRSDGQVNVFMLARNAGTSVNQIELFYAGRLPISREMARNLQLDVTKVEKQRRRFRAWSKKMDEELRNRDEALATLKEELGSPPAQRFSALLREADSPE